MAEFREKVGSIFPPVPKNYPPQSKTEFKSVSDLLQYLDDEYSTKKDESDKVNTADISEGK